MLGVLALVFAVLIGALWIYRHWQRLLLQRTPVSGLRVVDVKSLGQRLSVYVVAYRHQQFLIGALRTDYRCCRRWMPIHLYWASLLRRIRVLRLQTCL